MEKPETLTTLRRSGVYEVNFRIPRRLPGQPESARSGQVDRFFQAGIPHDHLPHIFERYFKKDDCGGSSGLGLAIVKRIIDLHGSSIDVKSTVGKGTSFHFALPVANIA